VYSLGPTLLYAATGGGHGDANDELQRSLAAELREVVRGCLRHAESKRPTPRQLLDILAVEPGSEGGQPPLPIRVEKLLARVEAAVDRGPVAPAPALVDTLPYTEHIAGPGLAPGPRVIGGWDPASLGIPPRFASRRFRATRFPICRCMSLGSTTGNCARFSTIPRPA
jgi:hypothetical protein